MMSFLSMSRKIRGKIYQLEKACLLDLSEFNFVPVCTASLYSSLVHAGSIKSVIYKQAVTDFFIFWSEILRELQYLLWVAIKSPYGVVHYWHWEVASPDCLCLFYIKGIVLSRVANFQTLVWDLRLYFILQTFPEFFKLLFTFHHNNLQVP